MRRKTLAALACYGIFGLILGYYIAHELNPTYLMSVTARLFQVLAAVALLYLGSLFLAQGLPGSRQAFIMRQTFRLMFIVYVLLILTYTLFDPLLGRSVDWAGWSFAKMITWFRETANLVPLRMIGIYWNGLNNGTISFGDYLMNMLGNVILMMPMALLLPLVFRPCRRFGKFIGCVIIFISAIELLQGICCCGYCDIDDLILNTAGAALMYGILKTKKAKALVRALTFRAYE